MREQLVKGIKKKHVNNFSTLPIDDMKTKEKHKSILLVYKYSTKHNNFVRIPKFLRTPFLMEHSQWMFLTYDKSFLVLVIIKF